MIPVKFATFALLAVVVSCCAAATLNNHEFIDEGNKAQAEMNAKRSPWKRDTYIHNEGNSRNIQAKYLFENKAYSGGSVGSNLRIRNINNNENMQVYHYVTGTRYGD